MPCRQHVQKVDWSLPHTQVYVWTNLVQVLPLYHPLQHLRTLHAALVHRAKPQQEGSWVLPEQCTATAKLCLDNAAVPSYLIFLCDDALRKYFSPVLYHLLVWVSIKLTSNAVCFLCCYFVFLFVFFESLSLLTDGETPLVYIIEIFTDHFTKSLALIVQKLNLIRFLWTWFPDQWFCTRF